MAQEGIYKNPIVLSQVEHKSVMVSPLKNFKFAQDLNSVPVNGFEFRELAKHYPIAFTKDTTKNEVVPIALLGLRNKGNLFIDKDGMWKEGSFIPGFIRRYPFALADNDATKEGNYAVCVDAGYDGFDKEEGILLFDDGAPTKEFNDKIEFLRQFQSHYLATQELIAKLEELNLFKDFTADITMPAGEKIGFKGLMMVDEKALLELEDKNILELFRRGFFAWIYAHLYSLSNFRALGMLEAKKGTVEKVA